MKKVSPELDRRGLWGHSTEGIGDLEHLVEKSEQCQRMGGERWSRAHNPSVHCCFKKEERKKLE